MNLVLFGIMLYVGLQLLIGLIVSRRIRSEDDYLLAGRSLGMGLATFTIFATWFGAETCVSSAGAIYAEGLSGSTAEPFGYGACLIVMGLVFAIPLWRRKLTTLADLFRTRYSKGVERLAVLMMVPTSILWAAAQIRAFGQVLDATAGMGVTTGIVIAAGVAIAYTATGGLKADVITDLIQGTVIILGLICVGFAVVNALGDAGAAWSAIEPERLNLFGGEDQSIMDILEAWAIPICGSVVAQELVARILAAKSPQVARNAAVLGGGMYLALGLIPVFIGLVGVSLIPNLEDPEQILPLVAQKHLPTFLYILFAGALVSAILSTVDSTLLAASALVSHNLILPLKPGLSEKAKVRLARAGVMASGTVAFGLALSADTIFDLVESASSFGSAGIFVIMTFGLFSKVGGTRSAFAALIAGMAVWLYGSYVAGFAYSYLASLAAALTAYFCAAPFEKIGQRGLPVAEN